MQYIFGVHSFTKNGRNHRIDPWLDKNVCNLSVFTPFVFLPIGSFKNVKLITTMHIITFLTVFNVVYVGRYVGRHIKYDM
jgi:hypothetical protein